MNTRVIHTRFWSDGYISELSPNEKLFFMYLITNEHVTISGVYELREAYIKLETGLTSDEIKKAKAKFSRANKFVFHEGWVRIINADKYQDYVGEKNQAAKQKQIALAPSVLFDVNRVSEPENTVSGVPDTTRNKKSEIQNKKPEIQGSRAEQFLLLWNKVHSTKYSAADPLADNLAYWLQSYTAVQIAEAVEKVKTHPYWKDKMNPSTFLRRKNPRGESVDYIGEILNRQSATKQLKSIV